MIREGKASEGAASESRTKHVGLRKGDLHGVGYRPAEHQ